VNPCADLETEGESAYDLFRRRARARAARSSWGAFRGQVDAEPIPGDGSAYIILRHEQQPKTGLGSKTGDRSFVNPCADLETKGESAYDLFQRAPAPRGGRSRDRSHEQPKTCIVPKRATAVHLTWAVAGHIRGNRTYTPWRYGNRIMYTPWRAGPGDERRKRVHYSSPALAGTGRLGRRTAANVRYLIARDPSLPFTAPAHPHIHRGSPGDRGEVRFGGKWTRSRFREVEARMIFSRAARGNLEIAETGFDHRSW
jgi:hypothetical protein